MDGHDDSRDAELERLRRHNRLLQDQLRHLEREVAAMRPVVTEVRRLRIWDFTPYEVTPDGSWLALDRGSATTLMQALAGNDHWRPWESRIEPRPQP